MVRKTLWLIRMAAERRALLAAFAFTFAVQAVVFAQPAAPAPARALAPNVREHKLDSRLMARPMSYRVVLPGGYDDAKNSALRYPVLYLLHGLTGNFSNWTDRSKLADHALTHRFIIVTPEGENGWYTDSQAKANDKYESYIVKELVGEIDAKYRTAANRENRMIAGLSMGGYGALKFGLKYPELFSMAAGFSGALAAVDLDTAIADSPAAGFAQLINTTVGAAFGPKGSDARKANDIFGLVRDATPEKIRALPFLYVSCGTEDFLIQNNRDFMAVLIEKKVPHEYRQHPGGHDWTFWDTQIREFLSLAERRLKK